MIVLDSTIVNVALPTIRTSLGFSETGLVWVVNAYLLTFGGFLLLGGRLADLYGQRQLFIGGVVVVHPGFAGLRPGGLAGRMLIVARAIQGLGGAVVSAVALSLIMSLFEDGPRARAGHGLFRLRHGRRRQRRGAARRPSDRARSTGAGSSWSTSPSAWR